jgi:intergrase/recombinase
MENKKRKTVIVKPYDAYHAYRNMLHYYAMKNMLAYMKDHPKTSFSSMSEELQGKRKSEWVNLGGQIMLQGDLDKLRADIGSGKLNSWNEIHKRYDNLWTKYSKDKLKHAYATLLFLLESNELTPGAWQQSLSKLIEIQNFVCEQVYITRKKDYDNPFRRATFRSEEEMIAALGTIEDNSFILQVRKETDDLKKAVKELSKKP